MAYNFKEYTSPTGHKFGVDREAGYGYWEYKNGSEGGGLWFEEDLGDGSLFLIDYDGAATLPKGILQGLRLEGFTVDSDFE